MERWSAKCVNMKFFLGNGTTALNGTRYERGEPTKITTKGIPGKGTAARNEPIKAKRGLGASPATRISAPLNVTSNQGKEGIANGRKDRVGVPSDRTAPLPREALNGTISVKEALIVIGKEDPNRLVPLSI